jgi:hypothetical protein
MIRRVIILVATAASATMAAPQNAPSIVGTISSTEPITINGSAMSSSAAPSWPLAARDEIATAGPSLFQTADRNVVRFEANSKARISSAGNGLTYIYVREGGVHFNARTGPIYICIGDRLFIPAKSAQGILKVDQSGSAASNLERGVFAEQGTRACAQDVPADFLSGLPQAAGGSVGGPGGGFTTSAKISTAVTVVAAVVAGTASLFSSAPCGSPNGCNFNPPAISPSQP